MSDHRHTWTTYGFEYPRSARCACGEVRHDVTVEQDVWEYGRDADSDRMTPQRFLFWEQAPALPEER